MSVSVSVSTGGHGEHLKVEGGNFLNYNRWRARDAHLSSHLTTTQEGTSIRDSSVSLPLPGPLSPTPWNPRTPPKDHSR